MKKVLTLLTFLTSFSVFSFSQTYAPDKIPISRDSAVKDLLSYLQPGKHIAGIIAAPGNSNKYTPRQQEIMAKAMKAMTKNSAWVRDSLAYYAQQGRLDVFREKLGLTEDEFKEYTKLGEKGTENNEISISGHDTLEIIRNDHVITFGGTGLLRPLDSLSIDLRSNQAKYKEFIMAYSKKVGSSNSNNAFKSEWSGNEYKFESLPPDGFKNMETLNWTQVSLQVSKLKNNGKTTLFLMAIQYVQGKHILNVVVPCIFE